MIQHRCSRRDCLAALATGWVASGLGDRNAHGETSVKPHNTCAAFSSDGKKLVVGSQAGVEVFDADSFESIRTIAVDFDSIHDLRFSPDGQWLAVAGGFPGESGEVAWIRWPAGVIDHQVSVHDDVVQQLAFAANGETWITASSDEVCCVFAMDAAKPTRRYVEHSRAVLGVTLLPDGETAVSGSRDETLRVWNIRSGESIRTLHNHSRDVTSVALQPKEQSLPVVASASIDLSVRFWQPTIGRMVRFARLPSKPLGIAWVLNGSLVAAACADGHLRLIDPVSVAVADTIRISSDWLFAVCENKRSSGSLAVAGAYGTLVSHRFADQALSTEG